MSVLHPRNLDGRPCVYPLMATPPGILQRHPVLSYFVLTFSISWLGALFVVAPHLLRHETIPKFSGILMFPAMLLGPSLSSIILTRLLDGPAGLRDLFSRMRRLRFSPGWFAALLIPPLLIYIVLLALRDFASPIFSPGFFWIGIFFGVPAGFFEEIGWMGFAFPRISRTYSALSSAILLGVIWGCWHLPVIDYLGTATPHGSYKLPYFIAFTCAMTAVRVIIAWTYTNTKSVLLAQLLHMSSTGALVIFSPPRVNAAQETLWYFAYALVLWMTVALIAARWGRTLTRDRISWGTQ